jgi:hypothetical protein
LPQPSDSDWDKPKPRHPIVGPASYPKSQPDVISAPGLFRKMDPEALFFAFYYQPDTYQQYLAAQVGAGWDVCMDSRMAGDGRHCCRYVPVTACMVWSLRAGTHARAQLAGLIEERHLPQQHGPSRVMNAVVQVRCMSTTGGTNALCKAKSSLCCVCCAGVEASELEVPQAAQCMVPAVRRAHSHKRGVRAGREGHLSRGHDQCDVCSSLSLLLSLQLHSSASRTAAIHFRKAPVACAEL